MLVMDTRWLMDAAMVDEMNGRAVEGGGYLNMLFVFGGVYCSCWC